MSAAEHLGGQYEGNHRRDVAVELGHTHIPAVVQYFGRAELHTDVFRDRR